MLFQNSWTSSKSLDFIFENYWIVSKTLDYSKILEYLQNTFFSKIFGLIQKFFDFFKNSELCPKILGFLNPLVPTIQKLGFSVRLSQFLRILEQIESRKLFDIYEHEISLWWSERKFRKLKPALLIGQSCDTDFCDFLLF